MWLHVTKTDRRAFLITVCRRVGGKGMPEFVARGVFAAGRLRRSVRSSERMSRMLLSARAACRVYSSRSRSNLPKFASPPAEVGLVTTGVATACLPAAVGLDKETTLVHPLGVPFFFRGGFHLAAAVSMSAPIRSKIGSLMMSKGQH